MAMNKIERIDKEIAKTREKITEYQNRLRGLVIGTDGERVYTVEGNSGDACKIKSYPVNYSCIKGYGLMNWN